MGLNLFKWFSDRKEKPEHVDTKAIFYKSATEIYIRHLAFYMLVNKIANAISKCEIMTYEKNKKVKGQEWYRWNIQPNKNQNATQFWHKVINTLYERNEVLVIEQGGELYVADSYDLNDEAVFYEHTFKDVTISNLKFNKTFQMSDVFYFQLNSVNLKRYLDCTLSMYANLINVACDSYAMEHGNKGVLKIDQYAEGADDFQETLKEILEEDFKTFFENPNAVLPLYTGYDYEQITSKNAKSTSRDIKAMFDDVIKITANALGIPVNIANGEVADTSKAIDEFLTFCIDPLIELLSDEMNRKLFNMSQITNGYYIKFYTKAIKHIDLLDVASAIDKLISSGCFTINDIHRVCGEDEINEPWANQYFMTKNYSTIEDILDSLKGGELDEKE